MSQIESLVVAQLVQRRAMWFDHEILVGLYDHDSRCVRCSEPGSETP